MPCLQVLLNFIGTGSQAQILSATGHQLQAYDTPTKGGGLSVEETGIEDSFRLFDQKYRTACVQKGYGFPALSTHCIPIIPVW